MEKLNERTWVIKKRDMLGIIKLRKILIFGMIPGS